MLLNEAIETLKKFKRPHWPTNNYYQYFLSKTGPHANLVGCSYFIVTEGGFSEFSTSLGLYAEEILANDWIICEET